MAAVAASGVKKYYNSNLMMVVVIMMVACFTTMSWFPVVPVQARFWVGILPTTKEMRLCWRPIHKVEGCTDEVSDSLFGHNGIRLDRKCCEQGIFHVTEKCWKLMFGFYHIEFPSMVKQYCVQEYGGAPSPSPLELAPTTSALAS